MRLGRQLKNDSWIFYFNDNNAAGEDETVEIPEDLSGISRDELTVLESDLLNTFDAIRSDESLTRDNIAELRTITAGIDRIRNEIRDRDQEKLRLAAEVEALATQIHPDGPPDEDTDDESDEAGQTTSDEVEASTEETTQATAETEVAEEPELVAAAAATTAPIKIKKRSLNVPLSEVQKRAPDPGVPAQENATVVVAPDVPNYSAGRYLSNLETLGDAVHRRAKTLSLPSGRATVATIKREFKYTLDREANPNLIWDIMKRAADPQNLVAAGGWCAPSEVIYDFFNIAAEDGIIDLPTVGVQRGGIRFPVSPSIADIFGNPDSVWLWTETDDIAAAQPDPPNPTKPCVRIPCPDFEEERLDCHGICVTAGNLMDSAFPELIQNHLQLTMAAHRHVINQRIIAEVVAASDDVAVTGDGMVSGCSIAIDLLEMIDLQATDYREKYRMLNNSILELVLPRWARGAIRSDMAKRNGQNEMSVTEGQMATWFNDRNVRVQYVSDWQLGGGSIGSPTAATGWPGTLEFLIYAAGTFVVGSGMDLDLGVVRDSALNETNDHTAAWTEECNLVAKIGHEGRRVIVPLCVGGCTGDQFSFCVEES